MKIEIISLKDVLKGRTKMVKDILEAIEELCQKYDIVPEDYHKIRTLVRARSFYFTNLWFKYLGMKISPKYYKKINEKGEKLDQYDEINS